MKPHRDDYARAFAERYSSPDTIASAILWAVVALVMLQAILAIIGWPERVYPCDTGMIYAEPGRVYDCTPQGAWRLRGAR